MLRGSFNKSLEKGRKTKYLLSVISVIEKKRGHPCIVLIKRFVYRWFLRLTDAITTYNTAQLLFSVFQVIGMNDSVCITENCGRNLPGWFHRCCPLQSLFAFKHPLLWLFLCFRSVIVCQLFVVGKKSTLILITIAPIPKFFRYPIFLVQNLKDHPPICL